MSFWSWCVWLCKCVCVLIRESDEYVCVCITCFVAHLIVITKKKSLFIHRLHSHCSLMWSNYPSVLDDSVIYENQWHLTFSVLIWPSFIAVWLHCEKIFWNSCALTFNGILHPNIIFFIFKSIKLIKTTDLSIKMAKIGLHSTFL